MLERDTVLAVLQSDIAIAGLVLVFSGFLLGKASEYDSRYGDKFRWLASAGMIPIVAALISAWLCIDAMGGNQWDATHTLPGLKIVLALTGIYAILSAAIAFFP